MPTTFSLSRWLIQNSLGGVFGLLLGIVVLPLSAMLGFGAGLGLGVGLFQARMLAKYTPPGRQSFNQGGWVAVSAGAGVLPGWLLAFALIMGASNGGAPIRDAAGFIGGLTTAVALFGGVGAGICGGLAGLIQGLLLRSIRPDASTIWAWALVSAAGWGASWAMQGGGLALLITGNQADGVTGVLLTVLGGMLTLAGWAPYALITAPLLSNAANQPGAPGAPMQPTVI